MNRLFATLCIILLSLLWRDASGMPANFLSDDRVEQEQALQDVFQRLYDSLRSTGGLLEVDEAAASVFIDQASAAAAQWPDSASILAMEIQAMRWLDDPDSYTVVANKYDLLTALLPDDAAVALAVVEYKGGNSLLQDGEAGQLIASIHEQYPADPHVRRTHAGHQLKQMRYQDVISMYRDADATIEGEGMLVYLDALMAEQEFDEGILVAEKILSGAPVDDPLLAGRARRHRDVMTSYAGYLVTENDIRTREETDGTLPIVEMTTSRGVITIILFEDHAPNTVANFIALAESGYYDFTQFHRLESNFMIQGGDTNSKPGADGEAGEGGPGYTIKDEHGSDTDRMHFNDSIAMAKIDDPDSAGSQFYFTHRPTDHLNGKHTVFGRVLEGKGVTRALRQDDSILSVRVSNKREGSMYVPETRLDPDPSPADPAPSDTPVEPVENPVPAEADSDKAPPPG